MTQVSHWHLSWLICSTCLLKRYLFTRIRMHLPPVDSGVSKVRGLGFTNVQMFNLVIDAASKVTFWELLRPWRSSIRSRSLSITAGKKPAMPGSLTWPISRTKMDRVFPFEQLIPLSEISPVFRLRSGRAASAGPRSFVLGLLLSIPGSGKA